MTISARSVRYARDGKAWRIDLMVGVARGAPTWSAYASLEPEVATRAFRRGRCAYLTTAPEPGSRETPRVWRRVEGGNFHYIQVTGPNDDARAAAPVRVQPAPNSPPPDADLVSIVNLIRDRAVPKPSERMLSDIQPWPIGEIVAGSTDVRVILRNPADDNASQIVRVRRDGGQWTVVELHGLGPR